MTLNLVFRSSYHSNVAIELHPDFGLGFFILGSRLSMVHGPGGDVRNHAGMDTAVELLQKAVELMPEYCAGWR